MAQPERRFKVGSCTVSVFVNERNTDKGTVHVPNVIPQRTYKDQHGNFQNTYSYGVNDIPKLILALQQCQEYLLLKRSG